MPLSDDDIREIVARAEQLQGASDAWGDEAEALVLAGQDLGIARSAMERALQEQRAKKSPRPVAGEMVFAKSSDDKYYAANVVSHDEHTWTVRFLRGGERTVASDELRPCPFLPGDRVTCPWPGWGTWTGTVLSYDAEAASLTVSDGWGDTAVFRAAEVWLAPRTSERLRRRRIYAALLGAGVTIGAALGALVTALII
jgi:hypothetical protein